MRRIVPFLDVLHLLADSVLIPDSDAFMRFALPEDVLSGSAASFAGGVLADITFH